MVTPPKAPARLGAAGRALWRRLAGAFELSTAELITLELACRQADDIAKLEALLAMDGLTVAGSKGQLKLSSVVSELRQQRFAFNRLIGGLALPDLAEAPAGIQGQKASSRRARNAAAKRWAAVPAREGSRRGASA